MSRWLSSTGFDGRASRIFAFSSLIVVVAGSRGKLRGLVTPMEGDIIWRVKVNGSGCSSSLVGASGPAGVPSGCDIVVAEQKGVLTNVKLGRWSCLERKLEPSITRTFCGTGKEMGAEEGIAASDKPKRNVGKMSGVSLELQSCWLDVDRCKVTFW